MQSTTATTSAPPDGHSTHTVELESLVRRIPWTRSEANFEPLLTREWLVANGLGGYASGTVSGAATRRYHGLLIAALPAPLGRTMMLSHLSEHVRLPDGNVIRLTGEERAAGAHLPVADYLTEFRLEAGLPVWRYELPGIVLEKKLLLVHEQNTAHVTYRLVEGTGPVRLKVLPSMQFRSHDASVNLPLLAPIIVHSSDGRHEVIPGHGLPPLRLTMLGTRVAFTHEPQIFTDVVYRLELSRGYPSKGELWSPGYFRVDLGTENSTTLIASSEPWAMIAALSPAEAEAADRERRRRLLAAAGSSANRGLCAELVLAADEFIVKPGGRVEDSARAHALGDDARTVIAGYHWFTDWGRDTMISFEGLTLATGRYAEAGYILRTFAQYTRNGLLPNMFPEGESQGLYHTADGTLWYFHAINRYLAATGDRQTLRSLLPVLLDIVEHHLRGTDFGIHVDPKDGLLNQGAEGYQLTWMDAKVGDWVVTPRRGKAVEICALWYNALRLLAGWCRDEDDLAQADRLDRHADQAYESFNRRFWYEKGNYLYDVIDGEQGVDDHSLRPNQLLAISLDHPVLARDRWHTVLNACTEHLLTPVGLRSLSPTEPDYKARYDGDLRARDAAYHQGTVWAWLIGPFVDAYLRVHPERHADCRRFLAGFEHHLSEACIGSISEVFDAQSPYTPRGCIAQAWSVAEVLRCLILTASASQ